ncbi:MAG TPA: hypothetical protein VIG25_12320 [Pyrinomonadaceae bacterium]|jgi:hypothetical protein
MKRFLPLPIFLAICCLIIGSATITTSSTSAASVTVDALSPDTNRELARARNATAKYHDFDRADAEGYEFLQCVPGEGLEYVNWSLVDCTFDIEHPEALHYIADGDGLRLVGVEYVVPVACTATAPEGFTGDHDEWEFEAEGLPIWALRAAIWLPNEEGMFAEHNPRIPGCP